MPDLLHSTRAKHTITPGKNVCTLLVNTNGVLQAANAPGGMGLAASNQVTLGFNLARAKEATGNLTQAVKEYEAILAEFPEYLDCYFRCPSYGNSAEIALLCLVMFI